MPLPVSGALSLLDIQTEFGGEEPIAITEYYGSGGDSVTPQPLGLTGSLFSVSGNNAAYVSRSVDVSAYAGHTVRIVFLHTGMSGFRADMQIDQVGFGSALNSFESTSDITGWQTTARSTAGYNTAVFYALGTGTTTGRWNRDSGGTGSSSTGLTGAAQGSFYIYTEATSYFTSTYRYYLRGPQMVVPSGGVLNFSEARYGSDMGTLYVYLDVVSQPTPTGAPSSGLIKISDFYGLSAPAVATATLTPDEDASYESTWTYLNHDRKGFGAQGKCDFVYPESVGGTHDDAFGSLTNTSGLISGVDVTSISVTQVNGGSSIVVLVQAQGSAVASSFQSISFTGYLPSASSSVTRTLSRIDSFFNTPTRLTDDGVANMVQWQFLTGTWGGSTYSNSSVTDIWNMISYADTNGTTVGIEVQS